MCIYIRGKMPPNPEFVYKKLYIYSYRFKRQSPSSTLPLMQCPYWDSFSSAQSSFWTHWFWCLLVLLLFFVSPLPQGKTFPSENRLHLGKQTTSCSEQDQVNREGGALGPCHFGQKLLNTQHGVGRCAHKSPITKWANVMSLQKKFTEAKCSLWQQRQLVHWYRWDPRTLT